MVVCFVIGVGTKRGGGGVLELVFLGVLFCQWVFVSGDGGWGEAVKASRASW